MIKSVLTVCIGNICRSPMAEELLRHAMPELTVQSAGLAALVGNPADPIALELMADQGADISAHRAQQLTGVMAMHSDLILVMDSMQKAEIQRLYPQASGKVFRLGLKGDVPDPYRKSRAEFEHALQLIRQGIGVWVPRIHALR